MKPLARVQTPTVGSSREHVWNHSLELPGFTAGDSLTFTLYSKAANPFTSDSFLGQARLQHAQVHPSGFDGELPLANNAALRIRVSSSAPARIEPKPDAIAFADPRSSLGREVGVVAFGRHDVDELCASAFLDNNFDLGRGGFEFAIPREPQRRLPFANAEAAFHAAHLWHKASEFSELSGAEALARRRQLRGHEDRECGGFLTDWHAMQALLQQKFRPGSQCASALLRTRESFLLYHADSDSIWSSSGGEGKNWLGLQLMLLRDRLSACPSWSGFLESLLDVASGQPLSPDAAGRWQATVRSAARAVGAKLGHGLLPKPARVGWICEQCTFEMKGPDADRQSCKVCETPRPQASNMRFAAGPAGKLGSLASSMPMLPKPLGKSKDITPPPSFSQWQEALGLLQQQKQGWAPQPYPHGMAWKPPPTASKFAAQWQNSLSLLFPSQPQPAHWQNWQQWQYPGMPQMQPMMPMQPMQPMQPQWQYKNLVQGKPVSPWSYALGLLEQPWWQGQFAQKQLPLPVYSAPPQAYGPPPMLEYSKPSPFESNSKLGPSSGKWALALNLMDSWRQQQSPQQQPLQQQPQPWGPPPAPELLALLPETVSESSEPRSLASDHLEAARALYRACQDGDIPETSRLLQEGLAQPDCRNPRGATPLFAAAHGNHSAAVRLLLEHRADSDRANNDSATPAFIAAQRNSAAALSLLLRARADPDRSRKDRATPTFIAAANGSLAALGLLLKAKSDPNLANRNGDTPLTIAAYSSHAQVVQMLLDAGANVNAPGYHGEETALDCARRAESSAASEEARQNAEAVVQLLVSAGALVGG